MIPHTKLSPFLSPRGPVSQGYGPLTSVAPQGRTNNSPMAGGMGTIIIHLWQIASDMDVSQWGFHNGLEAASDGVPEATPPPSQCIPGLGGLSTSERGGEGSIQRSG